ASEASLSWTATSPGAYEWMVRAGESTPGAQVLEARAGFIVEKEFEGIQLFPPLVGGHETTSNELQTKRLKKFEITFRWKPVEGVEKYTISFGYAPDLLKPILEKIVAEPSYSFNKGKIYSGRIYYRVRGYLKSGFVPQSDSQMFTFNFLPPIPVMPE